MDYITLGFQTAKSGPAVDDTNPACPNIPTVLVYEVMQDFYHQQYLYTIGPEVGIVFVYLEP